MSTIKGREWYTQVYLASPHWKKISKQKLRKEPVCQECDFAPSCDPHHLHYKTLWHEDIDNDLLALCRKCHYRKWHTMKWFLGLRPSSFLNPFFDFIFSL